MSTHLWIPDYHAHPDYDNSRAVLLGKLAVDYQVDTIVCIGDWADIPSLCSYDRGKRSFEGKRYTEDILIANEALLLFDEPFKEYNSKQAKNKKALYRPEMYMLLGNHEDRINTATQISPELHGAISVEDFNFKKHGWEVIPFGESVDLDGVTFAHYFASGIMGRPIGGEHIGDTLISKLHSSVVQGHSHTFSHGIRTRPDGTRLHGMSIGCFVHEDYVEPWCAKSRHLWFNGAVIAKNVKDGDFTFELFSQKELKARYG